jgi:hypothetical protein
MKICGIKCGYCTRMGHINDKCWEKGKVVKTPSTTNNYLEVLVDDNGAIE